MGGQRVREVWKGTWVVSGLVVGEAESSVAAEPASP